MSLYFVPHSCVSHTVRQCSLCCNGILRRLSWHTSESNSWRCQQIVTRYTRIFTVESPLNNDTYIVALCMIVHLGSKVEFTSIKLLFIYSSWVCKCDEDFVYSQKSVYSLSCPETFFYRSYCPQEYLILNFLLRPNCSIMVALTAERYQVFTKNSCKIRCMIFM